MSRGDNYYVVQLHLGDKRFFDKSKILLTNNYNYGIITIEREVTVMTQLEIVKKALDILGGYSEWTNEDEDETILGFGAYSWTENLYEYEFVFGKFGEYLETVEHQ